LKLFPSTKGKEEREREREKKKRKKKKAFSEKVFPEKKKRRNVRNLSSQPLL
jgi:hypothetical protein